MIRVVHLRSTETASRVYYRIPPKHFSLDQNRAASVEGGVPDSRQPSRAGPLAPEHHEREYEEAQAHSTQDNDPRDQGTGQRIHLEVRAIHLH